MEWPPDPDPYALDAEIHELLMTLVDAATAVPRPQRRFKVHRPPSASGAVNVFGAEINIPAAPQDLSTLSDENLIERQHFTTSGSYEFFILPLGFKVVEELRQRGEPQEVPETAVKGYIDTSEFRVAHPIAHARLRDARDLVAADPVANATRIGHECREAIMAFADSLADRHGVATGVPAEKTIDKIRAVIDGHRATLGERTNALLDALLGYWGAVIDITQRQEHAAAREGERLSAADARRVLFYTGLVMYELDVTFP
jgi:hypothetical protein